MEADAGIKEYLAKQIQDLNIKNIEKTHELVMVKQKLSEYTTELQDIERTYKEKIKELERSQLKIAKEAKKDRKRLKIFEAENSHYKEIFDEMQSFVKMIRKTKGLD